MHSPIHFDVVFRHFELPCCSPLREMWLESFNALEGDCEGAVRGRLALTIVAIVGGTPAHQKNWQDNATSDSRIPRNLDGVQPLGAFFTVD